MVTFVHTESWGKRIFSQLFFTCIATVLSNIVHGQTIETDSSYRLLELKSIVLSDIESRDNPAYEFAYTGFRDKIFIAKKSALRSKGIDFFSYNPRTSRWQTFDVNQRKKDILPYAGRFVINDRYLIIVGHKQFAIFKKSANSDTYQFRKKVQCNKYYLPKLNGSHLQFTYCYNFTKDEDKSGYGIYNLETNEWIIDHKIQTKGIYFTHLTPNAFLTFNGNNILHIDPVSYTLTLTNSENVISDTFMNQIDDWSPLDTAIVNRINRNINIGGKSVIGYLNTFRLKIDRCQQIINLTQDTFLVSYYRYDSIANSVSYFFDLYTISDEKIICLKTGIKDPKSVSPESIVNESYPSMHTYNAHIFVKNKLFIIKNMAKFDYYGKTNNQIIALEESYFSANNGVLGFFVYDILK